MNKAFRACLLFGLLTTRTSLVRLHLVASSDFGLFGCLEDQIQQQSNPQEGGLAANLVLQITLNKIGSWRAQVTFYLALEASGQELDAVN